MWVSTETIYQSLYVQSRGALKRELTRYLRTGRALRKPGPRPPSARTGSPTWSTSPSARPRVDARAVPGHWEGDLLIGKRNATAIGTLVERSSGFAMLVPLPHGYKPEHVAPALARKVQTLAASVAPLVDLGPGPRDARLEADPRRRRHRRVLLRPHAPWQRGSNENTNGLLRQYFPKGTDFSKVTEADLDAVADELNERPRKRLDFANPTEQLTELLLQ
jgi:IS30 family transposase